MSRIRRLVGGTVVARGVIPCNDRTVPYLKWYRLYSDRWLVQGSVCNPENVLTNLQFPFASNVYNVQLMAVSMPTDNSPERWVDAHPEYISSKKFMYRRGPDRTNSDSAQVVYTASGIVSEDTFKNIIAGKEWDPTNESWGGEYLVNIETGSRELILDPGRYRVYMVGKGGEAYANFTAGDGGWWGTSGGAGGTVIAGITLAEATSIKLDIDDSNEQTALYLGSSGSYTKFIAAGYGKKTTSSVVTNTGGTNTVTADSRITVNSNVNGDNSKYGATYIFAGGDVTVGEVESSYGSSTSTRYGNSGQVRVKAGGGITATPGSALIMLYKYGD